MTKQEEIREGLAKWLCRYFKYGWEDLDEGQKGQKRCEAQSFMTYLHSQGVVIKVKGIFDDDGGETKCVGSCNITCHNIERHLLRKANYVAVEPLVKE